MQHTLSSIVRILLCRRRIHWRTGCPAEIHDPVCLPSLPAVRRKCLLPAGRIWSDVGPHESYLDRFSVPGVVAEKESQPVAEFADDRRIELAWMTTVKPPDRPLFRDRIERAQRGRSVHSLRSVQNVIIHICRATQ